MFQNSTYWIETIPMYTLSAVIAAHAAALMYILLLVLEIWLYRIYNMFFDNGFFGYIMRSNQNNVDIRDRQLQLRIFRNPQIIFRGSEYHKFYLERKICPLTDRDIYLSSRYHLTCFTIKEDMGNVDYRMMKSAWESKSSEERIKIAYNILSFNKRYVPAYVLIAEEKPTTIVESEKVFKQALEFAENRFHRSKRAQYHGPLLVDQHIRNANSVIYIKRNLAICARRSGKFYKAIGMFRNLIKDPSSFARNLNMHENLIEVLLKVRSYKEVQALLNKYDKALMPKSATICYTDALLKVRLFYKKKTQRSVNRHGYRVVKNMVMESIFRAVEFNPHVPQYLLQMKSLILPPENIIRRGDTEAIAYATFHIEHWKGVEGALDILKNTWKYTFEEIPRPMVHGRAFLPYPGYIHLAETQLLPDFHKVLVHPKKQIVPGIFMIAAGIGMSYALLILLMHNKPEYFAEVIEFYEEILEGINDQFQYYWNKTNELLM